MSKKVDEKYCCNNKDDLEEEDRKCPPHRVPSLNPNEDWVEIHKPEEWTSTTRSKDDPREPGTKCHVDKDETKVIAQKREAVAVKEAVIFDEKEEIKGRADGNILASNPNKLWVSNEDRNTVDDTFGGQPNYSLGAEAVDIQRRPCPNATEEGLMEVDYSDWVATCAIYGLSHDEDHAKSLLERINGTYCGTMEVALCVRDTALILRAPVNANESNLDPRFVFHILSPETDAPKVKLRICYGNQGVFVQVTEFSSYPPIWPISWQTPWLRWLNKKATSVLDETSMSFAVCEFIENQGLFFLGRVYSQHGLKAIVHMEKSVVNIDPLGLTCVVVGQFGRADSYTWKDNPKWSSLERYARQTIRLHWKDWMTHTCPICFDTLPVNHAVEITCGHFFCRECISMHARVVLEDIKNFNVYPFKCPSCSIDMNLDTCVKTLLEEEEFYNVQRWHRDLVNPPSHLLQMCPRKCCLQRDIRKVNELSDIVFCDVCGSTWCERCMARYRGEHQNCDPTAVILLCQRYRAAGAKKRAICEDRWPWIKEYAEALIPDVEAMKWVEANASKCPKCRTAIERTEGCFHMQCTMCWTHFCYECGDELFPPFYGTHHCWEDTEDDFHFDFG